MPIKKRSFFRRHFIFTFIFSLLVLLAGTVTFLIWGGPLVTDAASFAAGKYFSGLKYLSISFDSLSGNPFDGYSLEGLAVGDKKTPDIVSAGKIYIAIDPRESLAQRKIILSASLDRLRTRESMMNDLLAAAQAEFPASPEEPKKEEPKGEPIAPLAFVVPQSFSAKDWAGDSGWKLTELSLDHVDPEKFIYKIALDAEYQKEKILLDAKTELSETAMPLWADARLRALESDVTVQAALKDGLITVKNIEGSLFNSPLKGSASFNSSMEDPEIAADITMSALDFKRLSKWVPDLGPSTLESFTAHVKGTLAHPVGQVTLKNANVAWQNYKLSDIESTADLNGKDVNVKLSANGFGTSLSASGNFALNPDSPLNFKASVAPLSLQDLEKYIPEAAGAGLEGTVTADVTATGTVANPQVHVDVLSPKIAVQKSYVFTDIGASVLATTSKLSVEKLALQAFRGRLSAHGSVGLTGKSPSLALEGSAEHIDLGSAVPGGTVAGVFDGNFSVGGTVARPEIALASKIDSLDAAQFGAKDITLSVNGSDTLNIEILGRTKMDTPFGGGGTVRLPLRGAKSSMDLKFNLDQMKLSELFPNTMKFSGELTMALLVSGSFEQPHVSAEVSSPEIQVSSFKIVDPLAKAVLNGQTVNIDASLAMGDRRPSVKGTVDFKKGFKCVLDVTAPGVSIDALEPSLKGVVDGRVMLKSHGVITDKDIDFSGSVTSPMVTAAGVPIMNVRVPFTFKQNKLAVPDGNLTLGGAVIHINANGDVDNALYTFDVHGRGIDLKKLTEPLGLPAEIEGKAEVLFKGQARTGFTTLIQGDGRVNVKNLKVDKFPGQVAVTGSEPFRVQNGNVFFNVDDDTVFLMPGTAISAPLDDTTYHFISLTGTVWKMVRTAPNLDPKMMPADLLKNNDDMYHIFVNGSINVRVLNGLLGGLGAVMEAGASGDISTQNIASNFVQQLIVGSISTQFRDFDLDVAGKDYSEVRINKLKFEGSGSYSDVDTTDWTEDAGQKKEEQAYSFSYSLPLGRDPLKNEKKRLREQRAAAKKAKKEAAKAKAAATEQQQSERKSGDN